MRNKLLSVLGMCLLGTSALLAQPPATLPPPPPPPPMGPLPRSTIEFQDPARTSASAPVVDLSPRRNVNDGCHFYAEMEYLMWWVKNAPLPVPLVTTGDPNVGFAAGVNTAGALGQPGTQVLVGSQGVDLQTFSGMRLTVGGWFGADRTIGVESSAFFLERRTTAFGAGSDPFGNPPLYFPAFNVAAGAERALVISDPLRGFAGDVVVASSFQLWGAEFNGLLNLWRRPGLEFS